MSIGGIILAAGASTRLGSPKQSVPYKDSTLLRTTVTTALKTACRPIVVVTGSQADVIRREIEGLDVSEVWNSDWSSGIASSIRVGLEELLRITPEISAVVLMVCDQPLLSANVIEDLISTHQTTAKPIVACQYAETVGVPALFARQHFPELNKLEGDEGAKKVIQRQWSEALYIPFPGGELDIDSPGDLRFLK